MNADIRDYAGRRIHFIGIGGSSMSGLASLLKEEGYKVTGSDRTASHKTDNLKSKGINIYIGHSEENINGADLIVYSAAISEDNVERNAARKAGIPQIERCELLGQLMRGKRNSICISGTHGKTTTTSMLAQVFMYCAEDPTIHIGGELDYIGGSTRRGTGEDFICEACEFHESFLKFYPTIAVILNIDEDHLDYFKDIDDIERAFKEYASLVPDGGYIVVWGDDFRAARVAENSGKNYLLYGLNDKCRLRAQNITYDAEGRASFTAVLDGKILGEFKLAISSQANMLDALAVIAVSYLRGLDMDKVSIALSMFKGAHRRFELTSITDGVKLYTDYGHNPAEIKNAIEISKLQPHNRLWSVWQPHTYSRTKSLFDKFVETFDDVDKLLITDICAAREVDPGDISSDMLINPIRSRGIDVILTPTFDDAEAYLRANWQPGDLVITHGCGDIDLLNEQIALHGDSDDYKSSDE